MKRFLTIILLLSLFAHTTFAAPVGTIMRIADAGKKVAMLAQAKALTLATKLQGLRAYAIKPAEVAAKLKELGTAEEITAQVNKHKGVLTELRTSLSPDHPFIAGFKTLTQEQKEKLLTSCLENPELAKLSAIDPAEVFKKLGFSVELPDLFKVPPPILDDTLLKIRLEKYGIDKRTLRRILGNKHLTKKLRTAIADTGHFRPYLESLGSDERILFLKRAVKDGGIHKLISIDPAKALKRAKLEVPAVNLPTCPVRDMLALQQVSERVKNKILDNEELMVHLREGLQDGHTFKRQLSSLTDRHRKLFLERAANNKQIMPLIITDPKQAFRKARLRLPKEVQNLPRPVDEFLAKLDLKDRMKNRIKNKHALLAQMKLAMVPGHPFLYYFGSIETRLRSRFLDRAIKNKNILPFITTDAVKAMRMGNIGVR